MRTRRVTVAREASANTAATTSGWSEATPIVCESSPVYLHFSACGKTQMLDHRGMKKCHRCELPLCYVHYWESPGGVCEICRKELWDATIEQEKARGMSTPWETINYWKFRVPELKEMLRERQLPVSGPKRDLVSSMEQYDKQVAGITGLSRCWFCGLVGLIILDAIVQAGNRFLREG